MQDLFISNRAWVQREQPSHGVSCILQEFREIFGLDAEFTQFDRMYFTFFLERDQCINEIGRCSNECSEVQLEVASTMPAKVLAQAILARAFKFFPSATATGRYL